jgi:hypothetical protein
MAIKKYFFYSFLLCFMFNNQWYPTRAFMIAYCQQLGQNNEYNLHQAVFELSKFIPIVSADITYGNYLPVANIKT